AVELFDEDPARSADIVLLVGARYAAGVSWLGWVAATFAVLTAYIRALGASLGQGQDFCGPMAKPHRMFFLTVGCLGAVLRLEVLGWALWIVSIGAGLTACRRVGRVYRKAPRSER